MILQGQGRLVGIFRQLRESLNNSKIYRTNFTHVYCILIIYMISEHLKFLRDIQ